MPAGKFVKGSDSSLLGFIAPACLSPRVHLADLVNRKNGAAAHLK